jgi:hypothetical protein
MAETETIQQIIPADGWSYWIVGDDGDGENTFFHVPVICFALVTNEDSLEEGVLTGVRAITMDDEWSAGRDLEHLIRSSSLECGGICEPGRHATPPTR